VQRHSKYVMLMMMMMMMMSLVLWISGKSESAVEVRHMVVMISNASLFSTLYEVEIDSELHNENLYISLTSDIMTKVCSNEL